MVENGRFGSAGGTCIVVHGDTMEELGEHGARHARPSLLDQAQAQVHVAQEPPFLRGERERPVVELVHPPDIVQEGRRDQEVGAEPWMELGHVPARRGHGNRVLEKPAGVGVVPVRSGRQDAEPGSERTVTDESVDQGT